MVQSTRPGILRPAFALEESMKGAAARAIRAVTGRWGPATAAGAVLGLFACYATPQELDEMREAARRESRPLRYDGRWRDREPAEAPAGLKPVIRLRAPSEGETVIEDHVQGRVVWQNKDLDDLVWMKVAVEWTSDGAVAGSDGGIHDHAINLEMVRSRTETPFP